MEVASCLTKSFENKVPSYNRKFKMLYKLPKQAIFDL